MLVHVPIIVDIHPNPYSYFVEVTFHLKNYHLLIAIGRTWTLTFPKLPALYVKLHIENVAITWDSNFGMWMVLGSAFTWPESLPVIMFAMIGHAIECRIKFHTYARKVKCWSWWWSIVSYVRFLGRIRDTGSSLLIQKRIWNACQCFKVLNIQQDQTWMSSSSSNGIYQVEWH